MERGQEFDLGQGKKIILRDWLGSDEDIARYARTSQATSTTPINVEKLLRYMMRHGHSSPFEFAEVILEIHVPMHVWRQWIRHRTASVSELSTRYTDMTDILTMETTPEESWRFQSKSNRQGSQGYFPEGTGQHFSEEEKILQQHAARVYKSRIQAGMAREQARKDLPLSTHTIAMWKMDLHNLLHFLELRMHPSAQEEIRLYANCIGKQIVAQLFPITWKAFCDYRLDARTFSFPEIEAMRMYFKRVSDPYTEVAVLSCQISEEMEGTTGRSEFVKKLNYLFYEIIKDSEVPS